MPDPVSTSASAATAASTGVSALVLALLGVDIQALALGLVGAILGLGFAPPAHWLHATARFGASTIFAAVCGRAGGEWAKLSSLGTSVAICASGIVLHLALSWLGRRFDAVADAGAARVGIDVGGQP